MTFSPIAEWPENNFEATIFCYRGLGTNELRNFIKEFVTLSNFFVLF